MSRANFFVPLVNSRPWVKAGFEGFAGDGKSLTMAKLAIGLHKTIASDKPIVFLDSGESAERLIPAFAEANVSVVTRKTRAVSDLVEAMLACAEGVSQILLVDSLSHFWLAFIDAYKKRKADTGRASVVELRDWEMIKAAWHGSFSTPFVEAPFHFLFTGRAGFEYENEVDEETGRRESYKAGVKLKAGDAAFDADLVVLMQRMDAPVVWRAGQVLKDRTTKIDGKTLGSPETRGPTFEDFAPYVLAVLDKANTSGPKQAATEDSTGALFQLPENRREDSRARTILIQKIRGTLDLAWPGSTNEDKRVKLEALQKCCDTLSWEELEGTAPEILRSYVDRVNAFVAERRPRTEETDERGPPGPPAVFLKKNVTSSFESMDEALFGGGVEKRAHLGDGPAGKGNQAAPPPVVSTDPELSPLEETLRIAKAMSEVQAWGVTLHLTKGVLLTSECEKLVRLAAERIGGDPQTAARRAHHLWLQREGWGHTVMQATVDEFVRRVAAEVAAHAEAKEKMFPSPRPRIRGGSRGSSGQDRACGEGADDAPKKTRKQ